MEHLARAEAFATRAGRLLLHVHIVDQVISDDSYARPITALAPFLNSVAPRMRSLILATKYSFSHYYLPILESCFANGVAGSFTQLTISEDLRSAFKKGVYGFIEGAESPISSSSLRLNSPRESLEDLWLPVKVLRLSGLYPLWKSKIYRGLVELHLTCWKISHAFITEPQLVGILTSSPQLRVLRFNLSIKNPAASDTPVLPVHLHNLEILNLKFMCFSQFGIFLRWIAPGSKPLRLIFSVPSERSHFLNAEVREFFSRSKVTKICAETNTYLWAAELLRLSPYLQVLALNSYHLKKHPSQISFPEDQDSLVLRSRLDRLYLLDQAVEFGQLEQMIKRYPVHEILVQKSRIFINQQPISDERELKHSLSRICPIVKIFGENERIVGEDWDLLEHSGFD